MRSITRRLRGALGTAITWSVGWAAAGFAIVAAGFAVSGDWPYILDAAIPMAGLTGLSGLIGGTVFSMVLSTVHARRRLTELRPLRMAAWGAAAGLLVPLGLLSGAVLSGVPIYEPGLFAGLVGIIGGLGAATAGGTVLAAQRSERLDAGGTDQLLP